MYRPFASTGFDILTELRRLENVEMLSVNVVCRTTTILASKIISLNFGVSIWLEIVEFASVLATFLCMWPAKIMCAHDWVRFNIEASSQ